MDRLLSARLGWLCSTEHFGTGSLNRGRRSRQRSGSRGTVTTLPRMQRAVYASEHLKLSDPRSLVSREGRRLVIRLRHGDRLTDRPTSELRDVSPLKTKLFGLFEFQPLQQVKVSILL